MDSVSSVLGITKQDANPKLILIEENHNTNSDFLLNAIILNVIKKNYSICLILFHNTFNHYQNICAKFGYNLLALKEKYKLTTIEPMKIVAQDIERKEETEESTKNFEVAFTSNQKILHNLITIITSKYTEIVEEGSPSVIIVDDLSHLFNVGFSLKEILSFVRSLRSIDEKSEICISTHNYNRELQTLISSLVNSLKYSADLFLSLDPLDTGFSSDANGKVTINWKMASVRRKYNYPESSKYLYKLFDRRVKIYASGISPLLA